MTKQFLPDIFGRSGVTDVFSTLQREVDKVFENFGGHLPVGAPARAGLRLDVAETDKDIEVTADIPGVEPADLDVQLRDGVLSIKGEKRTEKDEKKKDYHLVERSYGMFERAVRLPAEVDPDKVQARFEKGVLKITMAKKPGTQDNARKITVKAA
jgi:HSP20 family protein